MLFVLIFFFFCRYYDLAKAVVDKNPDVPALKAIGKECVQVTTLLHRRSESMRQESMEHIAQQSRQQQPQPVRQAQPVAEAKE